MSSWELATRLSYFLWATMPDDELRRLPADGSLQDPGGLSAQVERHAEGPEGPRPGHRVRHAMAARPRHAAKPRRRTKSSFPTFDDTLREALFEETVLFFQDLFQNDRPVREILDADHTFLNETLARHYGIPGVAGPQWRRVDGVKKYGRGGVLALAQRADQAIGGIADQSRAARQLAGGGDAGRKAAQAARQRAAAAGGGNRRRRLTVRQMVEKHARVAECAVCHQRIDPFGFALEKYDPIGRFRDKDLAGRPIDAKAKLKDGTRSTASTGCAATC